MLLELGFASPLLVPRDVAVCKQVVDAYSNTVVALDQQAATATRQALGSSQSREAADIALRLWRHACHDAGMARAAKAERTPT